jgi:type I restriction enzyme S subunit
MTLIQKKLPDGWEWKALGMVADIVMGQSPPGSSYNKIREGCAFLQGNADFGHELPNPSCWTTEPRKRAKSGSVLFSVRAPIGAVNIANKDYCIGRGLSSISFHQGDNKYLYYLLRRLKPRIEQKGTGSTFKAISKSTLEELVLPLPPLETQRKIVAILEKAEATQRLRAEADELMQQLVQSVFLDMFGDPVRNPKGWKLMKVPEIAKDEKNAIKAGPFGSSLKKECYVKKGYKVYGQEQVIKDDLDFGDYFVSEAKYRELESYKVQEGDVLISLVGSYGHISVVPQDFQEGIINPRLMKISLNQDLVTPAYFKQLFLSKGIKAKIKGLSHGGTMDIINLSIVKQLDLPIPPLYVQQKFETIADKIKTNGQLGLYSELNFKNLFTTITEKAFTGYLIT